MTTTYSATFMWYDALENESIPAACARVEREHGVRLHSLALDERLMQYEVVFYGSRENLRKLYLSQDGGGYDADELTDDMLPEVTK